MTTSALLDLFNNGVAVGLCIVLAISIVYALLPNFRKKIPSQFILVVLILSSIGLILSPMLYQYYFGFPACTLCWYQRIFMWPIGFIVLGTIWQSWEKRKIVFSTIKWLAIAGLPLSLFHITSQWGATTSEAVCTAGSVSCDGIDVIVWGFLTIPLMAGIGFISLFLLLHTITKK